MVGICSRRKDFVIFSSSTVGEKSIFFSQVAQGGKSQVFFFSPHNFFVSLQIPIFCIVFFYSVLFVSIKKREFQTVSISLQGVGTVSVLLKIATLCLNWEEYIELHSAEIKNLSNGSCRI